MLVEGQLPSLMLGEHKVKVPIVGGAMSIAVAGVDLAAAIANEGGAGTLGGVGRAFLTENRNLARMARTFGKADCLALERLIDATREKSPDGVIGVNILMAARWHEPMIKTAVGPKGKRPKIDYLVVGAGFHEDVPEWVKDHPEVALVLMASSDRSATMLAGSWWKKHKRKPDAIVMEAPIDAGGHLGAHRRMVDDPKLRLEYSIPALRKRLGEYEWGDITIIGAGGIWDRADIDRVLAFGADGVQMATRFVCTQECAAPESFKQKYIDASKEDIVLVDSPVGYPGRAIRNKFIKELEAGNVRDRCKVNCLTKCACRESKGKVSFCIIDRLVKAVEGDADNGLVFCGSNAWRSKEQGIVTVKQIFDELCRHNRK